MPAKPRLPAYAAAPLGVEGTPSLRNKPKESAFQGPGGPPQGKKRTGVDLSVLGSQRTRESVVWLQVV